MIPAHNLNTAMQRRAAGKESATGRMKAVCLRLIGVPGHVVRHARKLIIRPGAAGEHPPLFGSVVRGDARPDSDIDVLVDIDPRVRFSLVGLVSVKNFLAEQLGRAVDVVTRDGIEPAIRESVFAEAERVF